MPARPPMSFVLRPIALILLLWATCFSTAQGQVTFHQPLGYSGGVYFVADFNSDGIPDLLGLDGGLLLGNGDGTFRVGTTVSGGAVAVGDFNGDGKPDVLQLGTGGPLNGLLLVLLGNGDGTFQSPITTYAYVLQYVIAGDLNGDGKADVVGFESTINSTTLVVYLSQGDGAFAPGVFYAINNAPLSTSLITLGDFNGDRVADLAVSLEEGVEEVVLLGNGDGTFQSGKISTGVSDPQFAIPGDFNDDGKLDLMLAGELLLGNGDGTFQTPTPVANGVAQGAGDFNGDGKLDIVVAGGATEICLGNGDGTFSDAYNYLAQGPFSGLEAPSPFNVADFNVDGNLDIGGGGYLLLGNGNGTFQGLLTQSVTAVAAVAGNFNIKGNGAQGVVETSSAASDSLYVLSNDGAGDLTLSNTYTVQQPSYGVATGDLNGDGNPDLVVAGTDTSSQDWSYSVLLGNGDDSFQSPQFYSQGVAGSAGVQYSMVVADFNNDHKPDVALGPVGTQSLAVLLGNGDGTFASPAYVYDGGGNSNVTNLIAADFNGDGSLDIAASPLGTNEPGTALLFGNGNGTFQPAIFPLGAFTAYGTADFNHDGKPDLWGEGSLGCQVLLGNGDGTFTPLTAFSPVCLLPIVVADMNGDGILDILADEANVSRFGGGYNEYYAYLGNGDGTFELPPIRIPTADMDGYPPTFELAVDVNGDGKPDLVSNAGSGYTYALLNTTVSAPGAMYSASTVTFSSQTVGTSSVQAPVTLTNTGAIALKVTSITVGGTNASEFSQTNNCTTVQPNTACTINITFTPTAAGTASASVTVFDNAGSGSQAITLAGTGEGGTAFVLAPASGSPTSATISPGNSASFMLAITPSGSFSGTVDLACSVSPAVAFGPSCSVPASIQVSAGTAASVTVTVNTAPSSSTGTVAHSNSPGGAVFAGWTVLFLASTLLLVTNRRRRPALALSVLALILLAGCGGGSSSSSTPANTYTATVTATSAGMTSKTTLTVIVQ